MKKVILSLAVLIVIGLTSCYSQNEKETKTTKTEMSQKMALTDISFGVRGNCGMCKKTIEKAANSVEGVASANWDRDKKKIDISYNESKTDTMKIHKAIAASGYDTERVKGSEEAYKGLPGCCKYDHEMKMNQSVDVKKEMAMEVYQCPMDCEKGKTYDKEGSCPVCKMNLKKVKKDTKDHSGQNS